MLAEASAARRAPSRALERQHPAGRLGDPRAEARVAPGAGQHPRLDLVERARPGHQDQVVAGHQRALGGLPDTGAVEHGLGLDAVGDHGALEAQLPAQQVLEDGRRLGGDPAAVQRRVERVRAHDQRRPRAHRGRERQQVGALQLGARGGDGHGGVVGVLGGPAQAGEVLGRGPHPLAPVGACGCRGQLGHLTAAAGKRSSRHDGAQRVGHVAHGGQVHVHAPGAQPAGGVAGGRGDRLHRPLPPLRGLGGRERQGADVAALLVGRHQGRAAGGALEARGQRAQGGGVGRVLGEQDDAGALAASQTADDVLGRGRAVEAHDQQLADPALQGQPGSFGGHRPGAWRGPTDVLRAGLLVVTRARDQADDQRQRSQNCERRQPAAPYWRRDRTVSRIFSAADGMAFSRRFMSHWSSVSRRIDERAMTVALRRSSSSRPISPK